MPCAKYGAGEMHFIVTDPDSWCNLPRTGGVAYAAQESWVQNETIRNNILFGNPYDEERYKQGEHLYYLCRTPKRSLHTALLFSHQAVCLRA